MSRLLLALWLLQTGPQGMGVVTGVVRSSSGSPAAHVRVYAVTYRDAVEAAKSPPALESLTETDDSGKYRLEIPPGRYHIASGSVASPTYYPGTTDISAARVITVAAGGIVSGIDFGSFVPANRAQTNFFIYQPAPPGNGVLSGVLRYADGKPASGVNIVAVPSAAIGSSAGVSITPTGVFYMAIGAQVVIGGRPSSGASVSDSSGAFRIENLSPETYYITAGYADAPVFYPGTTDIAKAKTITTTNNSKIDALDFTVLPPPSRVTISGKVLTSSAGPAVGAGVHLRSQNSSVPAAAAFGLPLRDPPREIIVGADGLFTFTDVFSPGTFTVEVLYSGIRGQIQNVVVAGQSINTLAFTLPIASVSGRILMEDGSPVLNPQVFGDAIVTTVNNPNIVASTIFPIAADGTFTRLHEGGEYRFYLRVLPEEYEIKSIQFGAADLSTETLKITGKEPVNIEIRVAKRSSTPPGVRVSGVALDSISGLPAAVQRVTLCCMPSGPVEGFSAPLKADGSFEFSGIPPWKYSLEIQPPAGRRNVYVVESLVEVGSQDLSGVTVATTSQFGQITARIASVGSEPFPEGFRPSIVFTGPMGRVRLVAQRNPDGIYLAFVPMGGKYDVSVENLPEGFVVESIIGDAVPVTAGTPNLPVAVTITIGRK